MSPPTLLIVPGSYSPCLAYYDLVKHIQRLHPALPEPLVYDLPSASSGPPLPPPTLYDDSAYFAEKISQLADTGTDIVLFAHSYGGAVAREAVKGFSKEERAKQGKKGGVVKLVYLSAVIPAPGQSLHDACSSLDFSFLRPVEEISTMLRAFANGQLPLHHVDTCSPSQGSTDYFQQSIRNSAPKCFNDLPQAEAVKWAARMTVHTGISFTNPVTELSDYDKAIPSTFIYLARDLILPPDFQKARIELLKSQSGADKVQVVEMDTGHCPNVSAPEELAKVLGKIWGA